MKNKRFFRTFAVLLAAVVLTCGFSVTAYANGNEDIPTDDSNVITQTPEPQPLTPEGNMTLVDDIEGDAAEDKQFIVVQSKGGNYFYIVIDKAAKGENTVHFLNQVDEADLMAIIEDGQTTTAPAVCNCTEKCSAGNVNMTCPVCSTNMTGCAGKEAAPDNTDEPQPEKEKSGAGGLVIFLVIALLGGGGALYYFKIMKPKQSVKGNSDLDDFDFDEYDENEPEADAGEADSITEGQEDDEE